MRFKALIMASAAVSVMSGSAVVYAEQTTANGPAGGGGGALTTSANMDFEVNVPKFVKLRVGAAGATVNKVTFDLSTALTGAGYIGDGNDVTNAVAGAVTGGDVGNGVVTASIVSNGGQVQIAAASPAGGLTDGGTNSIPYTEILTTSSDAANFPAPTLTNGASAAETIALDAGSTFRTNRSVTWTYSFSNSAILPHGTYGGTNTNGSRVTYTAAIP